MKTALLAAAAALALSTGATIVTTAPALADTVNTSPYRPFGTKVHRTDRVRERIAVEHDYTRSHRPRVYAPAPRTVYVPAPRPYVAPEILDARAHLADVRDRVYADGRVTLFEKIKLKAAENRYHRALAAYR